MKDSVKWIIIVVALALLIGGAYFLYNSLSENMHSDNSSGGGFIIDLPSDTATITSEPVTDELTKTEGTDATDTTVGDTAESTDAVDSAETAEPEEPTYPATNFTVFDADGNQVSLTDMRGKPVVVNFWASWCPPCKAEMPDFDDMYKKYGDKVVFMMVNMTGSNGETVAKAKSHVANNGYSFPVYFDTNYSAALNYNVVSIPATYLIDAKGNLVGHKMGLVTAAELEEGIKLIID